MTPPLVSAATYHLPRYDVIVNGSQKAYVANLFSHELGFGIGPAGTGKSLFALNFAVSAVERGVQLAAVGVSIGPFADARDEDSVAAFLQRFRYLSVRDERSRRLAQAMGLQAITHAGCDLAALLPVLGPRTAGPASGQGAPVRIGVAPCRYRKTLSVTVA